MLNYSLFNKYILRTPSLSLSFYNTLIKKSNIDFFQIKKNKSIMLSLFIASKTVHDKIVNHERLTTKELLNLELTTFKYLIRSSTRSTPFGLFSKISIQPFLGKKVKYSEFKKTGLNYSTLLNAINKEEIHYDNIKELHVVHNPSIYSIDNSIRYTKISNSINFDVIEVKLTDILRYTLSNTDQSIVLKELFKKINAEFISLKPNEILDYLNLLLREQIIISELEPNFIGYNYQDRLIKLSYKIRNKKTIEYLEKLDDDIQNKHLILKPFLNKSNSYYVDSFFSDNIKFKVNEAQLLQAIKVIGSICPNEENDYLSRFKSEFSDKYKGESIKLPLLFDDEYGLTFDKSKYYHFDFLNVSSLNKPKPNNDSKDHISYLFFKDKLEKCLLKNELELKIKDSDLDGILNPNVKFNDTFSVLLEYYSGINELFYFKSIGGSTGCNLISRFSSNNNNFNKFCTQIVSKEKELSKIPLAEINFVSNLDMGKIYSRPVKRDYEINLISYHSGYNNIKLNLDDLYVYIKDNQIKIKSKKYKTEVKPILSNSQNYNISLSRIFTFLSNLQFQETIKSADFYWNSHFLEYSFLPRVTYKNFILEKATWNFKSEDILGNFKNWKKENNIPNRIVISNNDQELVLDLNSENCCRILKKYLTKKKNITFKEFIFNSCNGINIQGEIYSNEILLMLYKNE